MPYDAKRDRSDIVRVSRHDFAELEVPPVTVLAVDGHGDPNTTPEYPAALAALYAVGYAVRGARKSRTGETFVVGPLEGLWTSDDPIAFVAREKDAWQWTMLLTMPPIVERQDLDAGFEAARAKHPDRPIERVEARALAESRVLQILHVGSFDDEGPTLARLHDEVMPERGYTFAGPHHEIYLSDARRVEPARRRTILRQPVRPLNSGA